jgi:predicted nucleic acid-binding protein
MLNSRAVVVDTHALVWFLEDSPQLSEMASRQFDEIEAGRATGIVPTMVLAELLHLTESRKKTIDFQSALRGLHDVKLRLFPLEVRTLERAQQVKGLELHDRIIVATALLLGGRLLTRDQAIRESGYVDCIW